MPDETNVTVIPPTRRFTYRVGIYCRVSTRSQEQLDSLVNQVSLLTRRVAATLEWRLVDTYLDIKSGSDTASRYEFQRMMNDCRSKKIDIILTKNISRFGRNTVETLAAINELSTYGVEVIFDEEGLSTIDPKSPLVISVFEGIAQAENESRRQNISWGIRRKVEKGTASLLNRKCYGYSNDKDGNLQIVEVEAEVVRLVFDLYLQGKSVVGIIRELESKGIPSPTGKDKWCKRTIDVMLSNEKYIGDVIIYKTYNAGYPKTKRKVNLGEKDKLLSSGYHPAIISNEIFSAVHAEKVRRSNVFKGENGNVRKTSRYSSKHDKGGE
jgi:site-specific DNA recombinase